MRKSLLALIVAAALLALMLVGCASFADSSGGGSTTPPAGDGAAGGGGQATSANPFVGTWSSDAGYVEYRADGTWVDGGDLPDGSVTNSTGSYEVVVGDGYYELRELWDDTENLDPMVVYVVFADGKAGFFETLAALDQNEILTMYTETAPGQWER